MQKDRPLVSGELKGTFKLLDIRHDAESPLRIWVIEEKAKRWQGSYGDTYGVRRKPVVVEEIVPPTGEELNDLEFKIKKVKSLLHAIHVFAVNCGIDTTEAKEMTTVNRRALHGGRIYGDARFSKEQKTKIVKFYDRASREEERLNYLISCRGGNPITNLE